MAARDAGDGGVALVLKVILHDIPGEFMGEFKRLDKPLLLEWGQGPFRGQARGILQLSEGAPVIGEALPPAHVEGGFRHHVGWRGAG